MRPFVKLNLPFRREHTALEACRGSPITTSTGTVHPFEMKGAYKIFKPEIFKLLDADHVTWCDVYLGIGPHIDVAATVRLNIYTITNGSPTTFYTVKPGAAPTMAAYDQAQRLGVPSIYKLEELDYLASFTAQQFDCYVLNTKIVHNVPPGDGQRSYIQFSWARRPFDVVLEQLKDFIDVLPTHQASV